MSDNIIAMPKRTRPKMSPPEGVPPLGRRVLHDIIACYGLAQTKAWLEQEIEALN